MSRRMGGLILLVIAGLVTPSSFHGTEDIAHADHEEAIHNRFVPNAVAFWSRDRGLIAGRVGQRSVVAVTRDGGQSWRKTHWTQRGRFVQDIAVADDDDAWLEISRCRDCRTRLLHSGNAGGNWKLISRTRLEDVSFIDASRGWGIRRVDVQPRGEGGAEYKIVLKATHNGGRTWDRAGRACRGRWLYGRLSRVTGSKGWAACAFEPATQMQEKIVTRTRDGGQTWTRRGPKLWGGHLVGIFFTRDGHSWMWTSRDSVYRTRDGGRTWRRTKFFEPDVDFVESMSFVTNRKGYAVYRNGSRSARDERITYQLITSRDGGRTWRVRQTWH